MNFLKVTQKRLVNFVCAGLFVVSFLVAPAVAQTLTAEKQQEVDELTKQIAANGNDYALYAKRGFVYLHGGSKEIAHENFEKALSLNPKWPKGYIFRAGYLKDHGKLNEAIRAFDSADQLEKLGARELLVRGGLKYKLGEYKNAIADFDSALRLKPDYADALSCRATTRWALSGPDQKVLDDYNACLFLNPGDKETSNLFSYAKRGRKSPLGI